MQANVSTLNCGGQLNLTNTTNVSGSSAAVQILGGMYIKKDISMILGGNLYLQNTNATNFSALNFYEEFSDTSTNNWSYGGSPFTHTVKWCRIGSICSFVWDIYQISSIVASYFTYTIPSRFVPNQAFIHGYFRGINNSIANQQIFWIYDQPSRKLQIYSSGIQANFTGPGTTIGFNQYSSSWCIL